MENAAWIKHALADETDTISKNVYIGGVNVSGMTEEQATKAVEEKLGKGTGGNYTVKIGDETTTATAETVVHTMRATGMRPRSSSFPSPKREAMMS